jgi:hypothetical protein
MAPQRMLRLTLPCAQVAQAELRPSSGRDIFRNTMDLLQQNAPDAAKMLMIHHAIINPEMHKLHWTDYLYQLQIKQLFLPQNKSYRHRYRRACFQTSL